MKIGYLKVETFIGERLAPVIGTKVVVECQHGNIIHETYTDENGHSERIPLKAEDEKKVSDDPFYVPSQRYKVTITHKRGFRATIVHGVEIFPGTDSILPVRKLPDPYGDMEPHEIFIPDRHTAQINERVDLAANQDTTMKDYIKNIASGNYCPTMERAALGANILLQMSIAIGKVQGGASIADDSAFVHGRDIVDNVSKVVDAVWGYYFVAEDGYTVPFQCDKEWQDSAKALAIRGYNPVQIVSYLNPKLRLVRLESI